MSSRSLGLLSLVTIGLWSYLGTSQQTSFFNVILTTVLGARVQLTSMLVAVGFGVASIDSQTCSCQLPSFFFIFLCLLFLPFFLPLLLFLFFLPFLFLYFFSQARARPTSGAQHSSTQKTQFYPRIRLLRIRRIVFILEAILRKNPGRIYIVYKRFLAVILR